MLLTKIMSPYQGPAQTMAVVAGLGTKMSIFILQPFFYTQNTQFSMFFPRVVVGGRPAPPTVIHRGQNPGKPIHDILLNNRLIIKIIG